MIIRCPQCEHTRSIPESKIPTTAELATCPKCKHRFRFRSIAPSVEPETAPPLTPQSPSRARQTSVGIPVREVQRPQSAFRESEAQRDDIWDAMDALHQRWEKQLDIPVTEVRTPLPQTEQHDSEAETLAEVPPSKARGFTLSRLREVAAPVLNRFRIPGDQGPPPGTEAQEPQTPQESVRTEPRMPSQSLEMRAAIPEPFKQEAQPRATRQRLPLGDENGAAQPRPRQDDATWPNPFPAGQTGEPAPLQQTPDVQEEARAKDRQLSLRQHGAHPLPRQRVAPQEEAPGQAHLSLQYEQALEPGKRPVSDSERERIQEGPPHMSDGPLAAKQGPTLREGASKAAGGEAFTPVHNDQTEESEQGNFVFPYLDGGPKPEERVEQDLQMLRAGEDHRPMRDLGMLRDTLPSFSGSVNDSPDDDHSGQIIDRVAELYKNAIPWENPATLGWWKSFMATVRGIMFKGPEFFSGFTPIGSLAPGYLFFLIMGYTTIFGALAWTQAMTILLPDLSPMLTGRVGLPVLLLLAPIALGLMQLFVTGCIRITLRICAPEQADFAIIYKIVSYSVAPFILSIVPFVGPPLGALWFLAALITGCRNALGLSWTLAVLAPLPPAIMLLFTLAWYFL